MACLNCEIRRAKLRTLALLAFGATLDDIALQLSNAHGEAYFVNESIEDRCNVTRLLRVNKLAPYTPHVIYERKVKL